ncbi:MAG: pyruvate, phosphate dikinase [Methanomassiliicoccales archaeon]
MEPLASLEHQALQFFEEGDGEDKRLLGGKGAGLSTMAQLGLPVPPGFVITTEVCRHYFEQGEELPPGLMDGVREAVQRLESRTGKGFGDPSNPLLVSVRSGAAVSMPGMMDTVLNLGLNDRTVEGLSAKTGDDRFAYDSYRRFIQLYGHIVMGIPEETFSDALEGIKEGAGVELDVQLDTLALKGMVRKFKDIVEREAGEPFPQDPYRQLERAIEAVFRSWMGRRAVNYRKRFNITPDQADGTAVNVVTMVFGNMGERSGSGVVFTRDPATGEKGLYGDYLQNAQGEDVVAGIRTPKPVSRLSEDMPEVYQELLDMAEVLEDHYKVPQDIEFTVEEGELYLLQTRGAKMNGVAWVTSSVDMVEEGIIDREEALLRIDVDSLEQILHKRVDPEADLSPIAEGISASPGAASGRAVFDSDVAEEWGKQGEEVILVRKETKPDDIHGFFAARGVLTSRGGKTSHAAVVARGMGEPCVVGCSQINIDEGKGRFIYDGGEVREGDTITIDGATGRVFLGEAPLVEPELGGRHHRLLSWSDEWRKLGVRANADTPEAASDAKRFGAQGIGLCRTERMFNAPDRLPLVEGMILADSEEVMEDYLERLLPMQREDFKAILREMDGLPVTVRLLDPPLHEFLPSATELQEEVFRLRQDGSEELEEKERLLERIYTLSEVNPMLGHRGVRIGLSHPGIYRMQIQALVEATSQLLDEGFDPRPQIMVPQVGMVQEIEGVREILDKVLEEEGADSSHFPFGTMMEVVRSALIAGEIAEEVDFFSFGTNDLTQATFSFSREDAENKFLPMYYEKGMLDGNPFQTLDRKGVGRLIRMAVEEGKGSRPGLEIGICGEHGGDPASIEFCHHVRLDYVSCSPYRIPIARLAAAQAALRDR